MNTQRLLRLAEELEKTDDRNFNMCQWSTCAMSFARDIPEFIDAGFSYKLLPGLAFGTAPTYDEAYGYRAIQAFFDIDRPTAYRLFSGTENCWCTREQVAEKIRDAVRAYNVTHLVEPPMIYSRELAEVI